MEAHSTRVAEICICYFSCGSCNVVAGSHHELGLWFVEAVWDCVVVTEHQHGQAICAFFLAGEHDNQPL